MALIRVDWNPSERKIRQFGLLLIAFSFAAACLSLWRGHAGRAGTIGGLGLVLGAATAALPASLGRLIYKAWMGVSFVIGSVVSVVIMGLLYFFMVTPMALIMKLAGRDALQLKRPDQDSYWVPLDVPEDKSYFERLF